MYRCSSEGEENIHSLCVCVCVCVQRSASVLNLAHRCYSNKEYRKWRRTLQKKGSPLTPSATKHTLQGGPGWPAIMVRVFRCICTLGGVWTFLSVWVWTNAFKVETLRISACHAHVQSEFLVRNQHLLLCLSPFSKSFLLLSSLEATGIPWRNVCLKESRSPRGQYSMGERKWDMHYCSLVPFLLHAPALRWSTTKNNKEISG